MTAVNALRTNLRMLFFIFSVSLNCFGTMARSDYWVVRKVVTAPIAVAATPPNRSQIDLSVGVPVKKRDNSDPKESEALIPKMISAIPTPRNASPIALFILFLSFYCCGANAPRRFLFLTATPRRPLFGSSRVRSFVSPFAPYRRRADDSSAVRRERIIAKTLACKSRIVLLRVSK